MSDDEIQIITDRMKEGKAIYWVPDNTTCRKVISVTERLFEDPEENEVGLCANFLSGEYVALYNCDLSDFAILERLERIV